VRGNGCREDMSFWIPVFLAQADGQEKTLFVVTPLNILGEQNLESLVGEMGLSAVAVSKENAKKATFAVSAPQLARFK